MASATRRKTWNKIRVLTISARNPAAIRAQWDKEVAAAKKTNPRYENAKEALAKKLSLA